MAFRQLCDAFTKKVPPVVSSVVMETNRCLLREVFPGFLKIEDLMVQSIPRTFCFRTFSRSFR